MLENLILSVTTWRSLALGIFRRQEAYKANRSKIQKADPFCYIKSFKLIRL
jgi:hypothetical protein